MSTEAMKLALESCLRIAPNILMNNVNVTEVVRANLVSEKWFETASFQTFKQPTPVKYEIATKPGVIDTLEGPVKYERGHVIMTGPIGEKYPITFEKFSGLYDYTPGAPEATPKKILKLAKLADHDGMIHTNWGNLEYQVGEDYIVRHGKNDYGVVKKDIFAQTYEQPSR